jgi:PIN domain nuclease of toxin-antitoxin system
MFVTDTHPLVWYIVARNNRKLSKKVREIFDNAIRGQQAIVIPSAVLWEISLNIKSGGSIQLGVPFVEFVERLSRISTFIEQPVTSKIIACSHNLDFHDDPFDSLIVATALWKGLPLITNDAVMHARKPCELFWD